MKNKAEKTRNMSFRSILVKSLCCLWVPVPIIMTEHNVQVYAGTAFITQFEL